MRKGTYGVLLLLAMATLVALTQIATGATFNMTVAETSATVDPRGLGASPVVGVHITVVNNDAVRDNVTVQTINVDPRLIITLDDLDNLTFDLGPEEVATIEMSVSAKPKAPIGDYSILVVGTSTNHTLNTSFDVTVLAPKIEISHFDIRLDPNIYDLLKGDDTNIVVRVWNNGTAPCEDLLVIALVDGREIGSVVLRSIPAGRYEMAIFTWKDVDGGQQNVMISTNGGLPDDVDVRTDFYIYTHRDHDPPSDLPSVPVMATIGLVGFILGMLFILVTKKG